MVKRQNFAADQVKSFMALTREREIVADNDMQLTHPSHLEWVLDFQKKD